MLDNHTPLRVFDADTFNAHRYRAEFLDIYVRLFRDIVGPGITSIHFTGDRYGETVLLSPSYFGAKGEMFKDDYAKPHSVHMVEDFLEEKDIHL